MHVASPKNMKKMNSLLAVLHLFLDGEEGKQYCFPNIEVHLEIPCCKILFSTKIEVLIKIKQIHISVKFVAKFGLLVLLGLKNS